MNHFFAFFERDRKIPITFENNFITKKQSMIHESPFFDGRMFPISQSGVSSMHYLGLLPPLLLGLGHRPPGLVVEERGHVLAVAPLHPVLVDVDGVVVKDLAQ